MSVHYCPTSLPCRVLGRQASRGRPGVCGAVVLVCLMLALAPPAAGYPMSAWNKKSLTSDFARMRYTTADRVVELRAFDLKLAPGVKGFTLGRSRVKDGTWVHGGVVIYYNSGKGYRMWAQGMGGARKVRPLALVDLVAAETVVPTNAHFWGTRSVKEPTRRARWPVLIVQSESLHGSRLKHETFLISLKEPKKPRLLFRLVTLSRRQGTPRAKGGRYPRFAGTRVGALRFVKKKNTAPALLITETRISTRFNRCKAPKPVPTRYLLQKGRFVKQPKKQRPGGCR